MGFLSFVLSLVSHHPSNIVNYGTFPGLLVLAEVVNKMLLDISSSWVNCSWHYEFQLLNVAQNFFSSIISEEIKQFPVARLFHQ